MPRVGVSVGARRIKTAGWQIDPKGTDRRLRQAMNAQAKPAVIKMCKEVVQGKRYSEDGKPWKHKITFRARFQMRGDDAVLYVYPTGKDKMLWTWTSRGTKPHPIDARNAPYLVFPYGGPRARPKTTPRHGVTIRSPTEKWASVKHVDHPGTKAREFEERIMDEYAPKFRKIIRRALTHR